MDDMRKKRGGGSSSKKKPSAAQSIRSKNNRGGSSSRSGSSRSGGGSRGKPIKKEPKKRKSKFQKLMSKYCGGTVTLDFTLEPDAQKHADSIGLLPEEIKKLRYAFMQIDYDESGEVDADEFLEFVDERRSPFTDHIFKHFDGKIRVSLLLSLLLPLCVVVVCCRCVLLMMTLLSLLPSLLPLLLMLSSLPSLPSLPSLSLMNNVQI